MKFFTLLTSIVPALILLNSCTTLENRRDLYAPQKVMGPYTKMLKDRFNFQKNSSAPKNEPPNTLPDGKSVVR